MTYEEHDFFSFRGYCNVTTAQEIHALSYSIYHAIFVDTSCSSSTLQPHIYCIYEKHFLHNALMIQTKFIYLPFGLKIFCTKFVD